MIVSGDDAGRSPNTVPHPDTTANLQDAGKSVLDHNHRFVDDVLLTAGKINSQKTSPLRSAIQELMKLDPDAFAVGTSGYGYAMAVLFELIHTRRRTDSHTLLRLVNDFSAWLRAQYLGEPTPGRHQPEVLKDGWPPSRVQLQMEELTEREKQVYNVVGDKPKNQKQILNILRKTYPGDFNETNELYRILATLRKCLLIKAISDGYVRLTST